MNSSGKVLIIFLVIISILLVSLTAISIFFFQKEIEKRENSEGLLEKSRASEVRLEIELKEVKKQEFLLEEKNKEADERINSLMDELELEEGLREEIKLEVVSLREKFQKEEKENQSIREELSEKLELSLEENVELEEKLRDEVDLKKEFEEKLGRVEKRNQEMEDALEKLKKVIEQNRIKKAETSKIISHYQKIPMARESQEHQGQEEGKEKVDLEKIVVVPNEVPQGRILSVDKETEFVIINLGEKDGVKMNDVMSVYRGKDYLGDIKVTRLQPEMAAADLLPPFSSRLVRKNDQVVIRQ